MDALQKHELERIEAISRLQHELGLKDRTINMQERVIAKLMDGRAIGITLNVYEAEARKAVKHLTATLNSLVANL